MVILRFGNSSWLLQEDVVGQLEPEEKTDPSSDGEDPSEEIVSCEYCAAIGWVGGDGAGVYGEVGYCWKGLIVFEIVSYSASAMYWASHGGVGGAALERFVNLGHLRMRFLRSRILILLRGSHSKMRLRIESSSGDNGRIELRNFGFLRYALKVESSIDARFHGFRPQVRFTRMIPRLHTSLGPDA